MRVLVLGPDHSDGSLPPYLDVLTAGLRHHGVTVDRHGSSQIPYDQTRHRFWPLERMLTEARAHADQVDLDSYDLVSLHFGNLEIEQLVPAFWADRRVDRPDPPVVYHVHTLAPTLLHEHVPDRRWNSVVQEAIRTLDGYVFFGQYARHQLAGTVPDDVPGGVAWLPTTIPIGTSPNARPALAAALDTPPGIPVISLYGYAAPWKDASLLRSVLERMRVPARVVLAGDLWNQPEQAGVDLGAFVKGPIRVGTGELVVVPGYLGPADRSALVRASAAGVFPYRSHPSFQGSGAIADYLAHAVPVVATDVANLAELVGDAGRIVPTGDPELMATALDSIVGHGVVSVNVARCANARAEQFTGATHAARCLAIYQHVLDADRRRKV
ncbi:glycosyltransferase [Actinoalloteichus sp. GBA129-24]|nr:glycosyltransferase [Actinoalloteichus sp. GBA129-24]